MFARYLLICILILTPYFVFSQGNTGDTSSTNNSDNPYAFLLLDSTSQVFIPAYKPVLGFGRGIFTFFGDVKDNYHSNPIVGRGAWIGTVSRKLNPYLVLNFNVTFGKLTGNAHTQERNLNFQSDVLVGGFSLGYNFKHLIKKPSSIMPFVSVGFESFEFNSKADLYDANGNLYNYWSDGTIRDIPEAQGNELNSVVIQRDYRYETDLRELNLDGLGKYPLISFAVPFEVGFEIEYSNRLSVRFASVYHMTFNNNIDNVSDKGAEGRKGNKFSDKFLFTYVTLHYDLFSPPKQTLLEQHYNDVQFASFDAEDEDNDGVIDLWDESPGTPSGVSVDSKGRPLDKDNDGRPDYEDQEPQSAKNANVDLVGVTYTEERMIAESKTPPAVPLNKLCEYYPSLCKESDSGVKKFKTFYLEIPEKFKPVDLNNDGYISVEELNITIDKFFDFGTNFTLEDLYELNDFFFDQ